MFRSVFYVCLFGVAFSSTLKYQNIQDEEWEIFKEMYHKKYTTDAEETTRKTIWLKNVDLIKKHNREADLGLQTFRMGLNKYSDLTPEEYKKYLNGFRGRAADVTRTNTTFYVKSEKKMPSCVDWRKHGYVTPVKDQKMCGSCWAFSVTGTLEGQHFKKTGRLVSLSEQNLVDCAWPEGCRGCDGCWPRDALEYIKTNPGVDTEWCYPYSGKNGNCHFNPNCVGATLRNWVAIHPGDETALQSATAMIGPISVAIDASGAFMQYKSGVYYDAECSSDNLDHAVLVVGYGTTEDGHDYWLVKNSWGTSWGEKGYIKMARNRHNNCGIATYATFPTGVGKA